MIKFLILIVIVCVIINYSLSADAYKGPASDHFDGKHFKNISNGGNLITKIHEKSGDELTAFSFLFKEFRSTWQKRNIPNGQVVPAPRVLGKDIVVTFINHSTVLIQTEGVNIITDPVWADRASPFPFLGSKRYMDPGVSIDSLPEIDAVLLTHNHYDHMDISALKKIEKRDKPVIYTPLGNSKFLVKKGIHAGMDMDWGDTKKFSDLISIDCVPAQHFSARALSDRNDTLWSGFVIRTPHGDIYFAGDTGYGPFVEHIKKVYPNGFRLAFLPIGAFKPEAFMSEMHANPEDAVTMYKDLKVAEAVPIHFGTFDMAFDKQDEPAEKIKELLAKSENSNVKFDILLNGETLTIK